MFRFERTSEGPKQRLQTSLLRMPEFALYPLSRARDYFRFMDYSWSRKPTWPLRSNTPTSHCKPFFIIGSGRSGTTLLRAVLSNHPDVFIPPENMRLGYMIRTFGNYRTAPWSMVVAAVLEDFSRSSDSRNWEIDLGSVARLAESLPSEKRNMAELIDLVYQTYGATHAPGKNRWGDKTPHNSFHLERIDRVFPTAQYLHVVRDGRDCVYSMVNAGMFNGDYVLAAYEWRDSVRRCRKFGARLKDQNRFFEVRYEDLVSLPGVKITEACHFFGLEPTEGMLHYNGVVDHVPDVLRWPHLRNVQRVIFRDSVGKWRLELPRSTLRSVMKIVSHELAILGYR